MSSCQGQSCETNEKGSSSHGCQGEVCGCGCKSCGCHQSSCSCKSCCQSEDKSKRLLALADTAWMELLKDKIKEHILATDKKIDEIAKIVAQTNHERWSHKMAKKQLVENYEESLNQLFDDHANNSHQSQTNSRSQGAQGQNNPPTPPRQY
jgi:hypothetical protein